jgi:hypothetical protein
VPLAERHVDAEAGADVRDALAQGGTDDGEVVELDDLRTRGISTSGGRLSALSKPRRLSRR